jgi:hypothetical protein
MPDHTPTRTAAADESAVVELRQYALHPEQRDVLIDLFDREFVETQEALGLRVMGQFRDLDDPDRFVWLRGFADMASRPAGLGAFYGGPVWAAHRQAANATMIDSDDVLLLRPAWQGAGVVHRADDRAPPGQTRLAPGLLQVTVLSLERPAGPDLVAFARERMTPALREGGADVRGCYVTEPGANNFPRLPVREGEHVLVVLALFADAGAQQSFAVGDVWRRDIAAGLSAFLDAAPRTLRLQPTARSALHA